MASTDVPENIQMALQRIHHQDWPGATRILQSELSRNPKNPDALHLMGIAAYQGGLFQSAVDLIEAAIRLKPDEPRYYNDCGEAYRRMGKLGPGIARFRRTLALDPGYSAARNNLASSFMEQGKIDEAIDLFRGVLQSDPRNADAHWNLSLALLMTGNFKAGWDEYDWRWQAGQKQFKRKFEAPKWNGSLQEKRTILVYCEQGFGDALQFIRYIPLVRAKTGALILECRQELKRIFECMPGIVLLEYGQAPPAYDLQIPIMSLPKIFGTTLDSIPADVPYLSCRPEIVQCWRKRLSSYEGLKIGLAWAGSRTHVNDHNRSCPPGTFRRLLDTPGCKFFSLQKRNAQEPLPDLDGALVDFSPELSDFAETAGLILALDLVISVDTAVVHLAGALARPVWTLLPFVPDWRWMLEKSDSPWYPTMRLFRQPGTGDWESVIRQVAGELILLQENMRAGLPPKERKLP